MDFPAHFIQLKRKKQGIAGIYGFVKPLPDKERFNYLFF
jgi:hypothetical protein